MAAPGKWIICDRCDTRQPVGAHQFSASRIPPGWVALPTLQTYCAACWRIMEYEKRRNATP